MSIESSVRERARALLSEGAVTSFIGWEAGRFENQTTPLVCFSPEDADRLVFNEYCVNNLGKYVLDLKDRGKVGLLVRGCDARAINRMVKDRQISRDEVYLIGLGCPQMRDWKSGEILDKCAACAHRNPSEYDELIGDRVEESAPADPYAPATEIAERDAHKRQRYFNETFEKCIRCYACRDVCPCCTCRTCFIDERRVGWQGKQNNLNENRFYGVTRAFHISDRCIDCGECERVCPMDLPIMALNHKLAQDMAGLFGLYDAGEPSEAPDVLASYRTNDIEEFM